MADADVVGHLDLLESRRAMPVAGRSRDRSARPQYLADGSSGRLGRKKRRVARDGEGVRAGLRLALVALAAVLRNGGHLLHARRERICSPDRLCSLGYVRGAAYLLAGAATLRISIRRSVEQPDAGDIGALSPTRAAG